MNNSLPFLLKMYYYLLVGKNKHTQRSNTMNDFPHLTDVQKLELASSLIGNVFFQYQTGKVQTELDNAYTCLDNAINLIKGKE